ncbi:unnamed protein product [Angiostrongylus costaricensis]|uniref:Reverse transcriptase domain-containing protein n=1 Tax=Angiostrongylus costaricensis TaxID=334426 RepID=A0A0R3PTT8_ANGCS|nr:unnamed protein product [Angiostrongylus costaricensis]
MPAHLTNIQVFLDRLPIARPKNVYVRESFDVTTLYTNVSNDSAMQTIRELLEQHEGSINMYSFSIQQLIVFLKIGDCFVICSTQEEMDKCFEFLNEQSEYIKFTREKPKENWLPFLNIQINLSENG